MRFLKSELARSLGLGFALGTALVALAVGGNFLMHGGSLVGAASAAPSASH